jgi:hypothetical protein
VWSAFREAVASSGPMRANGSARRQARQYVRIQVRMILDMATALITNRSTVEVTAESATTVHRGLLEMTLDLDHD